MIQEKFGATVRHWFGMGAVIAMAACGPSADDAAPPPSDVERITATIAAYDVRPLFEGLQDPMGLAVLPDGQILVAEKAGTLRLVSGDGATADLIVGVPPVFVYGQGGLLDIALHPSFIGNKTVFISFTQGTEEENRLIVVSAKIDGTELSNPKTIFQAKGKRSGGKNFGGRLLVLPDETLLISSGDGDLYREEAQGLMTHFGKVIRIQFDGSIPTDNPFQKSLEVTPEIWTLGHRDVQGLALDEETGRVFATERAPRGGDELNLLRAGRNYGWPAISYGREENGMAVSAFTEQEGMEQPITYWTPSLAPAGLVVYRGEMFPDWQGDILVAALDGAQVRRIDMSVGEAGAPVIAGQEMLLADLELPIRDIEVAKDGSIYVVTDGPDARLLHLVSR